jgi:hypothetical protein
LREGGRKRRRTEKGFGKRDPDSLEEKKGGEGGRESV